MDYTTLAQVKLEGNITTIADDTRLAGFITAASRAIDHRLTGDYSTECHDYLKQETIANQEIYGRLDYLGNIIVNAHKPIVTVAELSYKFKPNDAWTPVTPVSVDGYVLTGWLEKPDYLPCRVFTKLTYTGGLSATPAGLPADIINAATVLTIRYWREAQSGLNDSIGIAELGTIMYTKAMPIRVIDILQPYMRVVPWRCL